MCFFCCGWFPSKTNDGLLVPLDISQGDETATALRLTTNGVAAATAVKTAPETTATANSTISRSRIRVPIYRKVSRQRCPLLDYTWEGEWPKVLHRCLLHPSETECVSDFSGRTALHLASFCYHGTPDRIAHVLIDANPHALIKQDSYGQTPLHYACQFRGVGANDLVFIYCQRLVQYQTQMDVVNACPAVTASPLYLACLRNAPAIVLQALVDTRQSIDGPTICWIAPITGGESSFDDASVLLLNDDGGAGEYVITTSPLSVLVDSCKDVFRNIQITTEGLRTRMQSMATTVLKSSEPRDDDRRLDQLLSSLDEDGGNNSDDNNDADGALLNVWLKCLILLREHHVFCDDGHVTLLHLVASLRVPVPELVDCCAQVFPDERLRRNNHGYTPLHCSLLNPSFSFETFSILLSRQPRAASMRFPNGQTLLATALEKRQQQRLGRGRRWGDEDDRREGLVDMLVMAYPEALAIRNVTTHLYPFQQAASLDANVSIIYGLLRLRPDILRT